MQISQFDNIRVVLAEPKTDLRHKLKESLQEHGFRSILDTGNLSQVVRAVEEGNVDMIIADTTLPEGDFNEYVRELRHGKHGDNPFLVTVTLVTSPSRESVHAAIDSGTDHVLAKPFTPEDLVNQVLELTHRRKRFVVTTDYIGPDRRTTPRPGMQIERVDVPNPLRQRMTGQMSEGVLRRHVDAAKAAINEQKVVRHAYQIGWLLDRLVPELESGIQSSTFDEYISRLSDVALDISKRIRSSRYAHVSGMCMTLSNMVKTSAANGFTKQDIQLLSKMTALIEAAFDPEREEMGSLYRKGGQVQTVKQADLIAQDADGEGNPVDDGATSDGAGHALAASA